jgi:hypothetical protein
MITFLRLNPEFKHDSTDLNLIAIAQRTRLAGINYGVVHPCAVVAAEVGDFILPAVDGPGRGWRLADRRET